MTCRNAATFAYDVYERFQKKVEAVAVVLDISDAKQCRLCDFFNVLFRRMYEHNQSEAGGMDIRCIDE